jgi:glucose 1-dehydrogenase
MERLLGKAALVTGASRGVGQGIALCLAEEGADVLVNYRTHPDEAQEVVDAITHLGRRAVAWQADVAQREQVQAMVQAALDHFGHLDIAVANAAFSVRQPILEAEWNGVQRTVNVTMFGVFHTCQMAAKQMVAQGQGGKIIIISSIVSEMTFPGAEAYNMSKAAINHLGVALAHELAQHHINVNVIRPGWIDTPGERVFYSEDDLQRGGKEIPWGRLGTVRDIGRTAVFLASEDADYITGATLRVDGGYMVGLSLPDRPWGE